MAEMRTRKHKVAQVAKRQEQHQLQYSLADSVRVSTAKTALRSDMNSSTELFGYSVELIKKDLLKTVIIGLLVTALLVAIVVLG